MKITFNLEEIESIIKEHLERKGFTVYDEMEVNTKTQTDIECMVIPINVDVKVTSVEMSMRVEDKK